MDTYGRRVGGDSLSRGGTVDGDLVVTGDGTFENITVTDTATIHTIINEQELAINDPLIEFGVGNNADAVNLGFIEHYNDGQSKYAGLIRGRVTKKQYLYKDAAVKPTTTTDISALPRGNLVCGDVEAAGLSIGDQYTLPQTQAAAGQVLTDVSGDGDLSWQDSQGGASTLQEAYDNSTAPQIETDLINPRLTVKQGAGAPDDVLTIQDSAGASNLILSANGNINSSGTIDAEAYKQQSIAGVLARTGIGLGQNIIVSEDNALDYSILTGNVIVGDGASKVCSIGNTIVGTKAGENLTGGKSVLLGFQSGMEQTKGLNVAAGHGALEGTVGATSERCVAAGYEAMHLSNTALDTTCIGHQAGFSTNSDGCVLLGAQTSASADLCTAIGFGATAVDPQTTVFGSANPATTSLAILPGLNDTTDLGAGNRVFQNGFIKQAVFGATPATAYTMPTARGTSGQTLTANAVGGVNFSFEGLQQKFNIGSLITTGAVSDQLMIRKGVGDPTNELLVLQDVTGAQVMSLGGDGELSVGMAATSYRLPTARGSDGQILQTDANGQVTWESLPEPSYGEQYFSGNIVVTDITVQNQYFVIAGTRVPGNLKDFVSNATDLEYTGAETRVMKFDFSASVEIDDAKQKDFEIGIHKNGVAQPEGVMLFVLDDTNQYPRVICTSCLIQMDTNDTIDVRIRCINDVESALFHSISCNITSINNDSGMTSMVAGGDVTGPSSSVSNNIPVFAGTTGKIIADGLRNISEIYNKTQLLDMGGNAINNVLNLVTDQVTVSTGPTAYVLPTVTGSVNQVMTLTGPNTAGWVDAAIGSGDVVGPAAAVSNNLVSFDGVTGKLVQDSGVSTTEVYSKDANVLMNQNAIEDCSTLEISAPLPSIAQLTQAEWDYTRVPLSSISQVTPSKCRFESVTGGRYIPSLQYIVPSALAVGGWAQWSYTLSNLAGNTVGVGLTALADGQPFEGFGAFNSPNVTYVDMRSNGTSFLVAKGQWIGATSPQVGYSANTFSCRMTRTGVGTWSVGWTLAGTTISDTVAYDQLESGKKFYALAGDLADNANTVEIQLSFQQSNYDDSAYDYGLTQLENVLSCLDTAGNPVWQASANDYKISTPLICQQNICPNLDLFDTSCVRTTVYSALKGPTLTAGGVLDIIDGAAFTRVYGSPAIPRTAPGLLYSLNIRGTLSTPTSNTIQNVLTLEVAIGGIVIASMPGFALKGLLNGVDFDIQLEIGSTATFFSDNEAIMNVVAGRLTYSGGLADGGSLLYSLPINEIGNTRVPLIDPGDLAVNCSWDASSGSSLTVELVSLEFAGLSI